jgi:hypothetical protein
MKCACQVFEQATDTTEESLETLCSGAAAYTQVTLVEFSISRVDLIRNKVRQ